MCISFPSSEIKNTLFSPSISEWKKLDSSLCNSESLRERFFNSWDQLPVLCMTVIILKELNLLREFGFVWATWKSTNSKIIFQIALILYATVVMILHPHLISSSTASFIIMKDVLSSALEINKRDCYLLHNTGAVLTKTLRFSNKSFTSSKSL